MAWSRWTPILVVDVLLSTWLLLLFYANAETTENKFTYWKFSTDLNQDPQLSTYLENYIDINVEKQHGDDHRPLTSLTFCLRLLPSSMSGQCMFSEEQILFVLSHPDQQYGFVRFHDITYMFMVPREIKLSPYQWYHICVSYEQTMVTQHVVMVMNGLKLVNESVQTPKNFAAAGFTLESTWRLGYCKHGYWMTGPLNTITRGEVSDFNVWSRFLSIEELIQFTDHCNSSVR